MSPSEFNSVLTLQPFYTGSHQQFIDGWIKHSRYHWSLLTLPGRHWKWRMRHSAIEFSQQIDQRWRAGERFDAMVVTDMTNLAELRGMLTTPAARVPMVLYFHENQFEYPNQQTNDRDLHFGFTNFVSAIAADHIWFNSEFNRDSFLAHLTQLARRWPDYQPDAAIEKIKRIAAIQPPGVDLPSASPDRIFTAPIHIVWAARWEHDKNPEQLLDILIRLENLNVDFRISVIGQQFRQIPAAFDTIRRSFANRILAWGYQDSRSAYQQTLGTADIFLATANHEFFGISAVEAIAMGCFPILPDRLSYPYLLQLDTTPSHRQFFYSDSQEAADNIKRVADGQADWDSAHRLTTAFRQQYGWHHRARELDQALGRLAQIQE